MGCTNSTDGTKTVFKSACRKKPTYRIPALVFQNGHFLAFSEKRLDGKDDWGRMNMVVKKGVLQGDSVNWFLPETCIYPEGPEASSETRASDDNSLRPMNPVPIVVDDTHIILLFNTFPENMKQGDVKGSPDRKWNVLIKHSYDGGNTWEHSIELPVDDIFSFKDLNAGIPSYCAIGPGHGIKLESGRLVVSGTVAWKGNKSKGRNFAIISNDNGATWSMGGLIPFAKRNKNEETPSLSGSECQPVDMGSNNVIINCRTGGSYPRIQCYSSDGCETFNESKVIEALREPNGGCEGSTISFKVPGKEDRWVLFSNPNCTKVRMNLSVRLSKNEDRENMWDNPTTKALVRCGSAYSDLAVYVQEGRQRFGCLYERTYCFGLCRRNIEFITFNLYDITMN